jgi:hypothetical protein
MTVQRVNRERMNLEVLKEAIEFSNKYILKLEFEPNSKYHILSLGIYCSLIELAKSFQILSPDAIRPGALTLYRSFLEYYVDIKNLSLDAGYIQILELDDAKTKKKQLDLSSKGNIYYSSLSTFVDERLPKYKLEISNLQTSLKKKSFSIKDKFIKANMREEYEGLYSYLCCEAHCSLSGITDRHFRVSEDQSRIEVMAYNYEKNESDIFFLANMANILVHAGELICSIINNILITDFQDYREQIIQSSKGE